MLAWDSAAVDDESQKEQTNNGDDLDGSEDEFGLTIDGDREDIQAEHQNDDERDPGCHVDVSSTFPELNDGKLQGSEGIIDFWLT